MPKETLQEIIQRKNERIENLEDKNKILFNQLYQARQDLEQMKDRIRTHIDDPKTILSEPEDKTQE